MLVDIASGATLLRVRRHVDPGWVAATTARILDPRARAAAAEPDHDRRDEDRGGYGAEEQADRATTLPDRVASTGDAVRDALGERA